MMKATGILIIFPILSFYVDGWLEYVIGVAPGVWSAKAITSLIMPNLPMNLTFTQYMTIGWIYSIILLTFTYSIFKKQNNL